MSYLEPADHLAETIEAVDANARLLLAEIRQARLKASQMEAALALVVGCLAVSSDKSNSYLLDKSAMLLRDYADFPDLAAERAGCAPEAIDPAVIRAAAAVLFGGEPGCRLQSQADVSQMH